MLTTSTNTPNDIAGSLVVAETNNNLIGSGPDNAGSLSGTNQTNVSVSSAGLAPLVLICHAPPQGTKLYQIRPGLHAGSSAVKEFVEEHQPPYFFCGHIHEAEGVEVRLGKTLAVNVGKRGYLLELD